MKIFFVGTPNIAAEILNGLLQSGVIIAGIITQPDKKSGRKKDLTSPPVKQVAKNMQIPFFQPINKDGFTAIIKAEKPDICVVAAYGIIIPEEALKVPTFGMINFHPSILPKYRGPSPITAAILNGDKETGVSIIKMSKEMDAGDILALERITVSENETNTSLEEKSALVGTRLIVEVLEKIKEIAPQPQTGEPSYTQMIKKTDAEINWENQNGEAVARMSRAFEPWPGIFTFWNNKKIDLFEISITEKGITPSSEKGQSPAGKVSVIDNQIFIKAKSGHVSPKLIRIEGKNKMNVGEFLRGYPDFNGATLGKSSNGR